MKKMLLSLFVFCIYASLHAQRVDKNVSEVLPRFHSFNSIQALNGNTTTSMAVNTVNGLQFNSLFAGVGVGFDYYFHTTIPLFLEARFDLVKRKRKLQLFGNGGLSFPFSGQNTKFEYSPGNYKTGTMYAAGLDYLVPVGKDAIIVGAAFSNKQVIHMVDNNIWNPVLNRLENAPTEEKYLFNRIAIRVGWMF